MGESTCLICGSANVLDGEPIPVVVQLEQKGVEFFPCEGLLVYRGGVLADFPRELGGAVPLRSATYTSAHN